MKNSIARVVIPLGCLVLVGAGATVYSLYRTGLNDGYSPKQPIPFSHKLHAGQYKIACMYCHSGVEKSKHATVPAMNVCMNCHSVVKPDSPHIQKLKELYLAKKEPFQWIKVHDLPDYVNFNHKRHIAKGVSCETCHGDVKQMDRVTQVKPMTMKWCIDCHKGETTPPEVAATIEREKQTNPSAVHHSLRGKEVAPMSCNTCHH